MRIFAAIVLFSAMLLPAGCASAETGQSMDKDIAMAESTHNAGAVLETYFKQMHGYYPPGSNQPVNPIETGKQTETFWNMKNRKARASQGRSMALFMMFRPVSWTITSLDEHGDSAKARVSFTIGNPHMLKLNRGNAQKEARYALLRIDGKWLINGFEMDR